MSRTIGGVAGESDIAKGIPTESFVKTNGSRLANALKRESIMKSDLVLLLTHDIELEQQSAMAAAASGARLIVARTVGVALEIIYQRGRELDVVVIDLDNGNHGMALLSVLSTSRADLPLVALTSTDCDHSTVLAYADGNACCLTKPINAAELEMVMRLLGKSKLQVEPLNPYGVSSAFAREIRRQKKRQDSQILRRVSGTRHGKFTKPICRQSMSQLHQP